ncbi:YmaF family protein [Lachnoclostridium phytofermentans]|uniref:YmaF family protein n=1 Tax=Lachnoclostridium phytofermentans (strain ATCC 700394 / DSM 18823 / ISDg) TaxID=357809 RepID=A9KNZ6_LACP7|nr:YmaF family protein [Lachnoclostridium phytofermentans]ABX43166.1 conserved hypothetical protein [Lachnoclostridium phytofermentans ISDg]
MDNPNQNLSNNAKQTHVHEIQGSVEIAEQNDPHSHRFATISGEAIPYGMDHYHEVSFKTDFFREHYHEFQGHTTTAIPIGNSHLHYLESVTTANAGHKHGFRFATLIDDPTSGQH